MGVACPACGAAITGEGSDDLTPDEPARAPTPGDIAICPTCRAPLRVILGLRLMTAEEIAALPPAFRDAVIRATRGDGSTH